MADIDKGNTAEENKLIPFGPGATWKITLSGIFIYRLNVRGEMYAHWVIYLTNNQNLKALAVAENLPFLKSVFQTLGADPL